MKIKINGETKEIEGCGTIGALLARLGIENRNLAVELNGDFLESEALGAREIKEGDALEIVRFVGGG